MKTAVLVSGIWSRNCWGFRMNNNKIPQAKYNKRWERGLRAHEFVKNIMQDACKMPLLQERWRPPLPLCEGLGEIDLIYGYPDGDALVFEVKAYNPLESDIELISATQLKRIHRSLKFLKLHYRFRNIRFFLAAVDIHKLKVEFLENP